MDKIDVLDLGFVRLIDVMGSDSAVVQAARVSYGAGTKTISEDRGLIRYMMRHEHWSPFEMCEVKVHIKAPIFVFRQTIRHRAANLNEASARYSILSDECYVPSIDQMRKQSKTNKQGRDMETLSEEDSKSIVSMMKGEQENAFEYYHEYLDKGLAREVARINLPLATFSEMYWKMDLRNLFHFLHLRLDEHAQYETREYAKAIYEIIKPLFPLSCEAFNDYVLNAKTFSAQEMNILLNLLSERNIDVVSELDKEVYSDVLSKREREEFLNKLKLET
jgi:thymidylate synthase (FAD)